MKRKLITILSSILIATTLSSFTTVEAPPDYYYYEEPLLPPPGYESIYEEVPITSTSAIQTRATSSNRFYTNTKGEYAVSFTGSDDANRTGSLFDYMKSYSSTKISWKPITITNSANVPLTVAIRPEVYYNRPDVNSPTGFSSVNWIGTQASYYTIGIPANSTVVLQLPDYDLTGMKSESGVQATFDYTITPNGSVQVWQGSSYADGRAQGVSTIEVQGNTNLIISPIVDFKKELTVANRQNILNSKGVLISHGFNLTPTTFTFKEVNTEKVYTYTTNTSSLTLNDLPFGIYDVTISSNDLSYLPVDGSTKLNTTFRLEYLKNFRAYTVDTSDAIYSPISVNLFYDYNRNGKQDTGEPSIVDSVEQSKIQLSAYTPAGDVNAMFVNSDPNTKKVMRLGQAYAQYTGAKYSVSGATSGVNITHGNILRGETVSINAPVFVASKPILRFYMDSDGDGNKDSGESTAISGKLTLKDLDGKIVVNNQNITNGVINLTGHLIDLGNYTYTITNATSSGDALGTLTGSLTIASTATPITVGGQTYVSPDLDIPLTKSFNTSGTVKDQWGSPIAGLTVKFGTDTATTDSSGRYSFTKPYTLSKEALTTSKNNYDTYNANIANRSDQTVDIVLNKDFFTVGGTVKNDTATPITGASINIDGNKVTTANGGLYSKDISIK